MEINFIPNSCHTMPCHNLFERIGKWDPKGGNASVTPIYASFVHLLELRMVFFLYYFDCWCSRTTSTQHLRWPWVEHIKLLIDVYRSRRDRMVMRARCLRIGHWHPSPKRCAAWCGSHSDVIRLMYHPLSGLPVSASRTTHGTTTPKENGEQ